MFLEVGSGSRRNGWINHLGNVTLKEPWWLLLHYRVMYPLVIIGTQLAHLQGEPITCRLVGGLKN